MMPEQKLSIAANLYHSARTLEAAGLGNSTQIGLRRRSRRRSERSFFMPQPGLVEFLCRFLLLQTSGTLLFRYPLTERFAKLLKLNQKMKAGYCSYYQGVYGKAFV
jgi:hypothetical protein